ncbi:MAG: hemolysin III family protein [Clostridia bacterium]|jgi:hemolysin III|nr:channel protein hemolysin III family [Clostridium sp. CAG:571]HJJ07490.1 hemolysin III family protein [Clostridiaceae bacterium]
MQTESIDAGRRIIKIPRYTLGEELISAISHGIGAGLGIAALVLCIIKSAIHHNPTAVVSSSIYGSTLIILYLISTLYHSFKPSIRAKKVFRIFDHCSIFLLIFGTYTPFALVTLNGAIGWVIFSVILASTIVGIVLNSVNLEKYKKISMACYIIMGWIIVFAFKTIFQSMNINGIILLVLGGIVYTIGAIIYGIGKKVKYMHSLWHFFVLAGSILHFFCIYLYVI